MKYYFMQIAHIHPTMHCIPLVIVPVGDSVVTTSTIDSYMLFPSFFISYVLLTALHMAFIALFSVT